MNKVSFRRLLDCLARKGRPAPGNEERAGSGRGECALGDGVRVEVVAGGGPLRLRPAGIDADVDELTSGDGARSSTFNVTSKPNTGISLARKGAGQRARRSPNA